MEIMKIIPISEPLFHGNEIKYLTGCINSGWISSAGKYVRKFEEDFAAYIGCEHGVALHTGTAALHLSLAVLDIGKGDEVIVPDLTFAATANAVLYMGAKPVLVDVEKDTWNIDPGLIEEKISSMTKAIIPVHLYGHPCNMDRVLEIAQKHNLAVIEDAAEAHGAEYKGKRVGCMSTIGCFSFYGNKIITTGEGGMCICHDARIAKRLAKLRDHGMREDKKYWHDEVGFNYRMTNLQAAVGVAQLERIEWFLNRKRRNAHIYSEYLSDVEEIVLPIEKDWAKNVFWMYTIILRENSIRISRDALISALAEKGIETRPVFYPLHQMPPYRESGSYPNAEYISAMGLNLPSGVTLEEEDIEYICKAIKRCLH